jgi:Tfp pilus assembly protein PilP
LYTTSATELTVQDYQGPADDWSRPTTEESAQEEMTQEVPQEVPPLEEAVLEVLVSEEVVREESSVVLTQEVPAQVETVVVDTPVGGNYGRVEVAEPLLSGVVRGETSTPVPPGGHLPRLGYKLLHG